MQNDPSPSTNGTDWIPRDGIPWVCPTCWFELSPSTVPQSVAQHHLKEHLASGHKKLEDEDSASFEEQNEFDEDVEDDRGQNIVPSPSSSVPQISPQRLAAGQPKRLVPCPHCPSQVREDRLQRHILQVHGKKVALPHMMTPPAKPPATTAPINQISVPTERLDFELLPPGTWDIEDVINHYRTQARDGMGTWAEKILDYRRLVAIKTLGPTKCYIGKELWNGYVVFEFRGRNAVLECPVQGNATYVLSGDWKLMVRHTKAYLRRHYDRNYTKVVHKGDWIDRIRQAL